MKKLKNTNVLFVISLLSGLLVHIFFLFIVPYFHDETYYATVPFRLILGDSLVQHEWHLTQFSTLFSYLPVYIWTAIKGSTDGIFIFLRCVYLLIHTAVAVIIYRFFRKYGKWAILASMIFYIQITYRIQALSYQSVFVLSLLLLTLCLISIYQQKSSRFYVFAGICFGCCCVCNPLFCFAFVLYLIVCLLWTKRDVLKDKATDIKASLANGNEKQSSKKKKKKKKNQVEAFPDMESYNCFFKGSAILRFTCGILIVAVIAVAFFFLTGGTIDSLFQNMEHLLGSSEYDVASNSILVKLLKTLKFFSRANFGMPWILPALFIVLLIDKKRRFSTHRLGYLSASIIWSILFIIALLISAEFSMFAISLPFCVVSTVCYILTENKNKPLFHCMYIPCLIAVLFHYLAADTHLAAIGIVLSVNNVAGVFFAKDLWQEMKHIPENDSEESDKKQHFGLCRKLIIIGYCIQILFHGIFYMYGQVPLKDATKATTGPFSGLYMSAEQCDTYNKTINDLDYIKSISNEKEPVLLATYNNWMYLYLERPLATYTTWYRGSLDPSQLAEYYKVNPEKKPKYIYIEAQDPNGTMVKYTMDIMDNFFDFTKEDLSNGVLLTVKSRSF